MEKFSKKLLTSKILDLGRKNRNGNNRSRKPFKFLDKISERELGTWLKYGVTIMIPLLILTPGIRITSPTIRIDEILLAFLVPIYVLYKLKKMSLRVSVIDYVFAALFVSVAISISFSIIRENIFYPRDLFEFAKLAKYYFIYRIIFCLDWSKKDIKSIIKLATWSFVSALIFSFMQYFNVFDINNTLMPYFTKTGHIRAIMSAGRVVGTFQNANSWALVLGTPLFLCFALLIKKIETNKKDNPLPSLFLLFLTFSSIIMTMSRTSVVANFLALFAISAIILIIPYRKIGRPKAAKNIFVVFSIFSLAALLSFLFITNIPNKKGNLNIVERFEIGMNDVGIINTEVNGESQSWSSRIEKWENVASKSVDSPIFGFGPSKSIDADAYLSYVVDNEYLLYLYRYGLLGVLLYAGLLFSFFWYSAINLRNTAEKIDQVFIINLFALGSVVSYSLYNILAGSFYNFQLFPLLIIWNTLNINFLIKNEA